MALEQHDEQVPPRNIFDDSPTQIEQFLHGRHILVSGGSGFIGKILVEKLLFSTADIGNIYVLIRTKRGEDPQTRLNKTLQSEVFQRVRSRLDKVVAVPANLCELGLGLSPEWRHRLSAEVSVVFHVGATTRFDAYFPYAVLLNTRGTREMLELATEMPNIVAFVHVSTTYCNTDRQTIDEVLYPPHADWRSMVRIAEKGDLHTLCALTYKLIGGRRAQPNTYTFSKSLAEHVVSDYAHQLPCLIFRPSIVISSDREPLPGWIDNFNGPPAILAAGGIGILHSVYMDTSLVADFVPVDIAIKAMIVAAWKKAITPAAETNELNVYNASTAMVKPVTIKQGIMLGYRFYDKIPPNFVIWLPTEIVTTNYTFYYISFVLLQLIPAIIADIFLKLLGEKLSLLRIQRKIYSRTDALSFFMTHTFFFKNKKFLDLDGCIKGKDRLRFSFKFANRDVYSYFYNSCLGGRRYLLKQKDEDLPRARANFRRLKVIYFIFTTFLKISLFFLILNSSWVVRFCNFFCGIVASINNCSAENIH